MRPRLAQARLTNALQRALALLRRQVGELQRLLIETDRLVVVAEHLVAEAHLGRALAAQRGVGVALCVDLLEAGEGGGVLPRLPQRQRRVEAGLLLLGR